MLLLSPLSPLFGVSGQVNARVIKRGLALKFMTMPLNAVLVPACIQSVNIGCMLPNGKCVTIHMLGSLRHLPSRLSEPLKFKCFSEEGQQAKPCHCIAAMLACFCPPLRAMKAYLTC